MHKLIVLFFALFLVGCITGENVTRLEPGMSQNQVSKIMGKPDGFKQKDGYTIYTYTNRLISGWSWDRADYSFIFKNGKLIEYGAGEVRQRDVGSMHSVFIDRMFRSYCMIV
jgi:hypothetical protein